jgi:hypothetical protein
MNSGMQGRGPGEWKISFSRESEFVRGFARTEIWGCAAETVSKVFY